MEDETLKKRLALNVHQVNLWVRLGNHFLRVAQGGSVLDKEGVPYTGGDRTGAWKEAEVCFWAARYLQPADDAIRRAWWNCYVRNRVKIVHDVDAEKRERNRLAAQREVFALKEQANGLIPLTLQSVRGDPKRLEEELRVCLNALERTGAV